jgi:transcription-repair coupling factor (superfamily II helicase)
MAPTTILSLQHYKTLLERFSDFPVNIAMLNRFSTKKDRESILNGLKKGTIDILVSTHSVYSDKIEFSNLGLVVIDEEQRFGVKIKEYLKSKYPYVDMLYLSATPIPRTLNMALNGIFDISVIKTPPLDRKPIETFVLKRKHSIIRDAILKELSRGGSVYFVHNNIETIERIKSELDSLVPFAKKSIVHAKMPKKEIKSIIEDFNDGKFNVLIATSIIESGLDIKNVNTIIVDNADKFGLSDLYQLRGRVGRGDRTAYAYLLRGAKITDDARKRLYFMKEFVERGVGFNLALKDMEIRGGGNVLGKDQSGKIKAVGFDTYASLIEEAISELKNEPVERDVEIRCSFGAYIDDDFANQEDKFTIYKMIYAAKTQEELEAVENEVKDTFGRLPKEVKNLFFIASLKIAAKKAFVKSLSISKKGVLVEFYVDANIKTDKLVKVLEKFKGKFISQFSVFFENSSSELADIYKDIKNILQLIV